MELAKGSETMHEVLLRAQKVPQKLGVYFMPGHQRLALLALTLSSTLRLE